MSAHEKPTPYTLFSLILSIFALLVLAVNTLVHLDPQSSSILDYADDIVCLLFFIDFLVSLYKAPNKAGYFFRWGWIELLSCIPAVDFLRIGRLARIVRILRVLRGFRAARILSDLILKHRSDSAFLAVTLLTLLLLVVCSVGVLQFETLPTSNIKTAEDAFWWSICTITTVGYGDHYPVSLEGRIIASILMFVGLGLIGIISGFASSWFMRPINEKNGSDIQNLLQEIHSLRTQVESLQKN